MSRNVTPRTSRKRSSITNFSGSGRLFSKWRQLLVLLAICLLLGSPFILKLVQRVSADTGTGSISLTSFGTAATENFDTLSNTAGSTTNTALPNG
ncbi:MAG: hypothetical protein QOI77_1400, partial [Blastocatellia bacterium]|nr:hypothetical protein [Blastocatellia bacterium]